MTDFKPFPGGNLIQDCMDCGEPTTDLSPDGQAPHNGGFRTAQCRRTGRKYIVGHLCGACMNKSPVPQIRVEPVKLQDPGRPPRPW